MSIHVGVFFGGATVEHEISVISAVQAMHSFAGDKYHLVPVYIAKDGNMYTGDALFEIDNYRDTAKLTAQCTHVYPVKKGGEVVLTRCEPKLFGKPDVERIDIAFPIMHGTNGEDGTVSGFFELLGLPYVGCDVLSAAIGMDKAVQKDVLRAAGVPVLPAVSFYARDFAAGREEHIERIEAALEYPLIVKPANLGSSVGIKKAKDRAELLAAVDLASSFAVKIVVEHAIENLKEINCSCLGDYASAQASALEEPVAADEILSYADKYMAGGSKGMSAATRKLPAELSGELTESIREIAVQTFRALGCNGVVRIDFLLDRDDGDRVYVNEVNTIPGSLAFYLWEAAGKPYAQLLDEMIELGFKRSRERAALTFTYDENIFAMKGTSGILGIKK
ncbi:D-alanine--D-alanine ligase family protein [Feifania hominis]|uniref:D-alanine--D-alanine ligase n=1 Tax=Feifania hominis TaxID=2763660 RepID=A0A926HUQ7_9FIRM|nr:D-alanine--D-alanine ligase family protein [Feifania hominis]MBC8536553.1 D-alanine--D-alanine ligase [Feifania hominis]